MTEKKENINYRITLEPLQNFFFGGEKHNEEYEANYYVVSQNYPQQTTLLGMLRFFLLRENGLVSGRSIENKKAAEELIGRKSFDYESSENEFGRIKSLGPLYLYNKDEAYYFGPKDCLFNLSDEFLYFYNSESFKGKKHYKYLGLNFISTDGKIEISFKSYENFTKEIKQVGNKITEKGGNKEDSFYRQIFKTLEPGWKFAFDAEIDSDIKEGMYRVQLGGERRFFNMEIKKVKKVKFELPKRFKRERPYILCISDCFLENEHIKKAAFGITEYVSFRNFKSTVSTKNHYGFNKKQNIEEAVVRSDRHQLLKRGSVLYFSDKNKRDEVADIIENSTAKKIGFNHILKN